MAKKIEINENWEPVEVEDLSNLFVVLFKQGSFDQGYVEAFDTDDVLMQSAYDNLAKQYNDCGCDECTKIYLIKLPNTEQVQGMCNTGLFNGNCCDPHVIEATRDLFNRADCEQISCWEGCGLTEGKKKKKVCSSSYCGFTDPALNIAHFNKCMGTGGLQNPDAPHLVVGDTLPNGPVADAGSSDGASASNSSGEGMGESLTEAAKKHKADKDTLIDTKVVEDDDLTFLLKAKGPQLVMLIGSAFANAIEAILLAMLTENKALVTEIKDIIFATYDISLEDLKFALKQNLSNADIMARLREVCDGDNGGEDELEEDLNDRYFICWNKVNPALKKPIIGDEASLRQKFDIVCEVKNIDLERYDFIVFNDTNDGIAYERLMPEVWAENTAYMALRNGDFYRETNLHEDIKKELKIQNNEDIEKDIEELEPPIDPEYFPNNMGINLSSVKKEKWVQQDDGQLKTITIEFDPATEEEKEEQGGIPGEKVEEDLTEASDPISRVEQVETEVERDGESPITIGGAGYVADLIIIRKIDNKYTAIGHTSTESGNEDDYEIFSGADEGYFDTFEDVLKYLLDNGYFDNKDDSKYADFSRADIEQYLNSKNESLTEDIDISDVVDQKTIDQLNKLCPKYNIYDEILVNNSVPTKSNVNGFENALKFAKQDSLKADNADKEIYIHIPEYRPNASIRWQHKDPIISFINGDIVKNNISELLENNTEFVLDSGEYGFKDFLNDIKNKFFNLFRKKAGKDAKVPSVATVTENQLITLAKQKYGPTNKILNMIKGLIKKNKKDLLDRFKLNVVKESLAEEALSDEDWFDTDNLTEATLDYYTQKQKMQQLNNGTRGFNAKASSDEKLKYNRKVCQNEGYNIALDIIEAEMVARNLIKVEDTRKWKAAHPQPASQPAPQPTATPATNPAPQPQANANGEVLVSTSGAVLLQHRELTIGLALLVNKHSDAKNILDYCMAVSGGTIRQVLLALIYAICLKKDPEFIKALKEFLTINCSYSDDLIKETIRDCLSNKEKIDRVNDLIKRINEHNENKTESLTEDDQITLDLDEDVKLNEAKRYVKRYYVRPQNIFCSNKEDILKALLRVEGENCSIYSLKDLPDHDDVQDLKPSDIIYYYDDGILYDKNHVKVMDYDLNVKHEEERKKFADVDAAPTAQVNDEYDDRLTDADLQDKETVANFRAINARQMK